MRAYFGSRIEHFDPNDVLFYALSVLRRRCDGSSYLSMAELRDDCEDYACRMGYGETFNPYDETHLVGMLLRRLYCGGFLDEARVPRRSSCLHLFRWVREAERGHVLTFDM
jgi:hypothetical protein